MYKVCSQFLPPKILLRSPYGHGARNHNYGCPTGTEHENVGQNPISSHLKARVPETQAPEARTELNLCSLCV